MKIFISTTTFAQFSDEPIKLLKSQFNNVIINPLGRKLSEEEINNYITDYDGVLAGTETYNRLVLSKAKRLKVISRLGIGLDNIDINFAKERNIKIYITQSTPALAVAELTLGLILDLLRMISIQNYHVKDRNWKKQMGTLLSNKTLGLIGLGVIGKKLINLTKGFHLNYLAYDIYQDIEFSNKNNVEYSSLEYLLNNSDIVSIHLNLSDDLYGFIDIQKIKKMKPNAILINTSRGEIINEEDLVKSLDKKIIAGAGLDVFSKEPYQGSLINYDNVITTPHIGAYASEIRMKMELEAAQNLIHGLNCE